VYEYSPFSDHYAATGECYLITDYTYTGTSVVVRVNDTEYRSIVFMQYPADTGTTAVFSFEDMRRLDQRRLMRAYLEGLPKPHLTRASLPSSPHRRRFEFPRLPGYRTPR
jgi:hypothetical protein